MENKQNKPEKSFRAGVISATIWQNAGKSKKGEDVSFRTISLTRSYKDKNDAWQKTSSFRINDLPKVELVTKKAYEYIAMQGTENRETTSLTQVTI